MMYAVHVNFKDKVVTLQPNSMGVYDLKSGATIARVWAGYFGLTFKEGGSGAS